MANTTLMKTKSEELNLPFSHVLSGYIKELVLKMVAEASYGKDLWLYNVWDIGIDVYKKKDDRELIFQYMGKEKELFEVQFVQNLKETFASENLEILSIEETKEKDQMVWFVESKLQEQYLPIRISIYEKREIVGFPKEQQIKLMVENNKTISVWCFPIEQNVAYHLAVILQQLELINEMDHYIILYDILKRSSIEGRKVKEELERLCEQFHVSKTEKPLSLWKTYRDYTYMRKKWKVLLRQEKREEPTWEEAFSLIDCFLEPIWESVCAEEVFFGDWMPEIRRFLD